MLCRLVRGDDLASERDHHLMVQLLMGTDSWVLAQLCVEHVQPAKESYLGEVGRLTAASGAAASGSNQPTLVTHPSQRLETP